MSGSIGQASTPFSDAEKTDLRRYMGYPAYGLPATSFENWRFFQVYGLMEFRFNNMSPSEYQVARQYLAQLYVLETAVTTAGVNMGTDQAAVWTRNKKELQDRDAQLDDWRRRLCGFFGIPPGPALETGGIRVVV